MRWQKRARIAVALFGIAVAGVVYATMRERGEAVSAERPARIDPRAILETAGAVLQQFREATQDYEIDAERQLTYDDGSTSLTNVTIRVRGRSGRDFVVSGREAQAGPGQKELRITGGVKLEASDGFVMTAESASFNQADAMLSAPGAIAFQKGGMSGTGVGMSYDQANDVLSLLDESHVEVKDEAGNITTDFTAGKATLARQENYLALEGAMHVLRGEQVLEADRGTARLSENEEFVTFIELRGGSRVAGGPAFDSMTADNIDLDYTDDGRTLERVALTGSAAIAMAGEEGRDGREFFGDALNLDFAPDTSLTAVVGRRNVRVVLPGAAGQPARTVRARDVDGAGEPGKGLTSARFTENVEYREAGPDATVARARALRITLDGDAVTTATFTGDVRFEERGFEASGASARYDPAKGTLVLRGGDAGGRPSVADQRITIEGDGIDVTLEGRLMAAAGNVRATLRPRSGNDGKLPGLLQQEQAATVNAGELDYRGATGRALFSGRATLIQGQTAVRGDVITIDQTSGDLTASGSASSTMMLDGELSVGRAADIRYEDRTRTIAYLATPASGAPGTAAKAAMTPVAPPARVAPGAAVPAAATPMAPAAPAAPVTAQLGGPQGDLRAARIEVILGEENKGAERLEAYTGVTVTLDARTATGDRLTYHADDARYVMSGLPTIPVSVVENCRETIGRTVTFFKSSERVIVDGQEEARTQSRRGTVPCVQPAPAAPPDR